MSGVKRQRRIAGGAVTVRDVAARAEVSMMTVSRVINGAKSVSEARRARVEAAIAELNFTPNLAAKQLAAVAGAKVGLLYDNPSAGFMSEFLLGALDESSRTGAQLVVLKHDEADPVSAVLAAIARAGVDGVVLPPPLCDAPETVEALRTAGVALVAIAAGRESALMPTVRIDNEGAAREIADHLLSLGHRRFGFIGGHPSQTDSEQRRSGFLDQLKRAGITDIAVEPGDYTYRSGLAAAERLLARGRPPTAIFAANDDMAAAVLAAAHRRGVEVPRALSVVGFDDTIMASTVSPALTTVRQPVAAMARTAVALLSDELRQRGGAVDGFPQLVQAHALVVRESTARAPKAT